MKIFSFAIILIFIICISEYSYSQSGEKYLSTDLIPLYDSLIQPPLNCEKAFVYTAFDSINGKLELTGKLKDQYEMINALYDDFEAESQLAEKNKYAVPKGPDGIQIPGSGPPQSGIGPPGGFENRPDNVNEIMEDMNNANLIMDKITVNTEKYKNELKKSVSKLNEELKSTIQNDFSGRVKFANEFLKIQRSEYEEYYKMFRLNMIKVRDIVMKYNNGKYLKFPPLKNDILRLQTATIENLKFLITITKEFSLTGAKFYYEEAENKL